MAAESSPRVWPVAGPASARSRALAAGTFVLMGYDNILTPALDNWIQESGVSWRFSTFKLVVFGLALILMMRFRPEGIFPSRRAEQEAD